MGLLGDEHVRGADDVWHVHAMNSAPQKTAPSGAQATTHHLLWARARRTMWTGVEIIAGPLVDIAIAQEETAA